MNREEILGLVDKYVEAWNAHDPDAVAAFYASDAISRDVGEARPDRDSIRRGVGDYLAAFPNFHLGIMRVGIDGDLIAVEWHATGTHSGPFLNVPATGRVVQVDGCLVARIGSDGLILSETLYWDVASLLEQIGLLPGVEANAPEAKAPA
jgi:steroid delta-isomerase-like uncharacterized protein